MNASTTSQTSATQLRGLFGEVAADLALTESILRRELRSDAPFVDELLRYVADLGGKRLRPALVLLSAQAVGAIRPAHHTLAAVVEMIHTATLVHDDILDGADHRRHRAAVHRRWDNHASVLLGDHLFTHAFYLASTLGDAFACQTIGKSTNIVCDGELRQVGQRGSFAISETEYLAVIGAKTAELCACCCLLGAHYADGSTSVCEALEGYGYDLGLSFQIADDVLDLVGDPETTGKTLGTDLQTMKLTLPVIHLLREAPNSLKGRIHGLLRRGESSRSVTELVMLLEEHGSLDFARRRAREYAAMAAKRLEVLAPSPSRETLGLLCDAVVARTH